MLQALIKKPICFICTHVHIVDKMSDIATAEENIAHSLGHIQKINFKLWIDGIDCACAEVKTPQLCSFIIIILST